MIDPKYRDLFEHPETFAYMAGFSDGLGWSAFKEGRLERFMEIEGQRDRTMAMMTLAMMAGMIFMEAGGTAVSHMGDEPHEKIGQLELPNEQS